MNDISETYMFMMSTSKFGSNFHFIVDPKQIYMASK